MIDTNICKRNKKRFISLILLFLFIISISSGVAFANLDSNSIPSMNIDLYLKKDGTLHVKKTIQYSFTSRNNYVYRDLHIESRQKPENIKISVQGAYSNFSVYDYRYGSGIRMYFYSNPEKTIPSINNNVYVTIEYDLSHVIIFHNDNAELNYALVGGDWYQPVGKLNANIHVESSNNVNYWLNTSSVFKNSSWNGNNLEISDQYIPTGSSFELNMIIPRNQFDANPKNGIIVNENVPGDMVKNLMDFLNPPDSTYFYRILAILMILASFTPLFIYLKYGREPKIDYDAKYEMDLPTDDPPAIVNAICGGDSSKRMGIPDLDGFRATILDLINRNYLLLSNRSSDGDYNSPGSLFLEINPDYDSDSLWDFEEEILYFLKEYEQDGIISMDLVTESLGYYNSSKFFKYTYKNWKKQVKKAIMDGNFEKAFYAKGDRYLKIFGFLGLATAGIIFSYIPSFSLPSKSTGLLCVILGGVSLTSLVLPQKIAGQWTAYGREYDAKWQSFKRYIEDYSLIKEYSPESINVWNKYLVYATALGSAKGVRMAMELSFPRNQIGGSKTSDELLSSLLDNAFNAVFESD